MNSYGSSPLPVRSHGSSPGSHRAPGAEHPIADYPDLCRMVHVSRWTLQGLSEESLLELVNNAENPCLERASWLPERRSLDGTTFVPWPSATVR